MLVLNKKINNLIGWPVLLLALFSAIFFVALIVSRASGRASAQDDPNQVKLVNIFPSAFETAATSSGANWQAGSNALANDLSDAAALEEFNRDNSAYFLRGQFEPPTPPATGPAAPTSAIETPSEPSPASETPTETAPAQIETLPADTPEPVPPDTTPVEASPTAPPADTPADPPPDATQPAAETQAGAAINLFDLVSLALGGHLNDIAQATYKSLLDLSSFSQVSAQAAEGEPDTAVASEANLTEPTIIFKDFSVPEDFELAGIYNAQLRLSLAGRDLRPDEKIRISYRLKGEPGEMGTLDLTETLSNRTNQGYLLFALPIFESVEELKTLEISLGFAGDPAASAPAEIYLDGLWLEIDYQGASFEAERETPTSSPGLDDQDYSLDLISPQLNFKPEENPDFNFIYKRKHGVLAEFFEKLLSAFWDPYKNIGIEAELSDLAGNRSPIETEIDYLADGEFHIRLKDTARAFRPGQYKLTVRVRDGNQVYSDAKDFSWGVLAVNTNKSIYLPTETAYLQMAVLDNGGNTVCDADLFLEITAPDGGKAYLDTYNGLVERNPLCGPNNVINEPDYFAYYGLAGVGTYRLKLTARTEDGTKAITDQFEVRENTPFDVERIGPTRIWPVADYGMELRIKAREDYEGEIIDIVPADFFIFKDEAFLNDRKLLRGEDYDFKTVLTTPTERSLKWQNLKFKAGDELVLNYRFDAPNVSPEFYLLGPLAIGSFREARFWQIAADAVTTSDGNAGTSVNWTNPTNAWDSTNNTYAQRDIPKNGADDSANFLLITGNNATDLSGTITKVEIGVEGYVQRTDNNVYLQPILDGYATGTAQTVTGTQLGTSDSNNTFYVDITSATTSWTWNKVINLDIKAWGYNPFNANKTIYVDQIRVRVTYTPPNSPPTGYFNSAALKTNGSGVADISIEAADLDGNDSRAKLEYVAGASCDFASSSDPSLETASSSISADFGAPVIDNNSAYQIGTSSGWIVTASGSNTVNFDWNTKTDLPSANGTYCLKLTVNDGLANQVTPATTTLTLDNLAPSTPGALSAATTSVGNEVRLTFGSASSDTNFAEYKIFYKIGSSGVTENDQLFDKSLDPNLAAANFNGATSTLLSDLESRTQYVFAIWAYDQYGNKASSTEITITTSKAKPVRLNTVTFLAGQYTSSDGVNGQLSDTDQTLSAFDFSLAETGAKIKDAFIIFETNFESYADNAGNYTGYSLAFDACNQPCTANAFSGTGAVSVNDNTVLAYDETGGNTARLLLNVTAEAQLASYAGGTLSGQVGYNIKRGTALNSISAAKAILAVTYQYYEDETSSYTNTVVYPLESTVAGDSGSRRASQADDCALDSTCPTFNYNVSIPEFSARLSQWYQTYNAVDGNSTADGNMNVNIQGADLDSTIYVFEAAMGGTQGNMPVVYFSGVSGYAENTAQTLEYHSTSPGGGLTYYLLGGETVETYAASTSAPTKTRTVSFPLGVINNGLTTTKSSSSIDVYFPENGSATGTVSIKKVWLRLISNNYNSGANTLTASSKVGSRAETAGYVYNYNPSTNAPKPSFNIIHVIPSADYGELADANLTSPKTVTVYTQNSSAANQGGTSAELMVTYTYSSEASGHLSSVNLFAGQTYVNGNAQASTTGLFRLYSPEAPSAKTMLAGGLLASYLISASDGTVPAANLTLDANLATGTPICVNAFNSRPDAINEFSEFYKSITANLSSLNRQTFSTCFSNDGGADATAGAKMNGILIYTYKWQAPPVELAQDNWRWYDNADSITPGAARAGERAVISNINLADVLRLRLNLGVLADNLATGSQAFKLQFAAGSDCAAIASSSWTDVGLAAGAAAWRGYNNPAVGDGSSSGSILLSNSDWFETYEEENPSAVNSRILAEGEYGEWDWLVYNNAATSSLDYCFRAIKNDGNPLTSYLGYPKLTTAASNTPPVTPSSLGQYFTTGTTTIANQAWINQDGVRLVSQTTDVNINEALSLYYQLITNGDSFLTATTAPASWCGPGTGFLSCASKIWAATSTLGDYRLTPFVGTTTITALPEDYNGYKWQVIACDDAQACSLWIKPGANPNFKVDLTPPSPPGPLTLASTTATSLLINFGTSTDEFNFDRYRIFYKKGTSSVSEIDTERVDPNLLFRDYGLATSTLVDTLAAGTQYVFNIWAYDLAGNKSSSTIELLATTSSSFQPPLGSFISTAQKTDGSGAIDIVILADDPDNDDSLRARLEYEAGSSCLFASSTKAYIDPLDANTTATYGDPEVDNNAAYQVGTSSGYIMTSPGANLVYFDWLSQLDAPGVNDTYCLRLTVNDGFFDQATSVTELLLIDNLPPTAPGNLTLDSKTATSATLAFGSQSTDASFDRYRIFFSTSSPVTEADTEQVDANLNFIDYNGATTTKASGLLPDTTYYFKIWAYDDFGNRASSTELTVKTDALPTNTTAIGQFKSDGLTAIANGGWTTESEVRLAASANDPDTSELLTLYFEFIASASVFRTATTVPSSACVYGTAYSSCTSKIWFVASSSPGNWSVTPYTATTSITGLPESMSGYKWQVIACDDEGACSDWTRFNPSAPNLRVDTVAPTAPGALTFSAKSSTEVTLAFGSSTSETNFSRYRIFYSTTTPVTTADWEQNDNNLNYINYNGASLTAIQGLAPNTQYYFNIWAFDQAGLSASSTEIAVTTSQMRSTPGVIFYAKNSRTLYYKVWDGTSWGPEQSGPTLGSAAGDNIRQIENIRSDDNGKVAVLAKTWDGANQEWWATVYRVAANDFVNTSQLGAALASATYNNLITGCLASLSGSEFFILRNNNAANGTLVYSWNAGSGWTSEGAGPNPFAVLAGCRLTRRPGTNNHLLTTYDATPRVGAAYYTGSSTYSNSWTTWSQQSNSENNVNNFVGDSFFDPGNNTRGALNYSNSAANTYTYGRYFLADDSSISYGSATTTPQTAPANWGAAYVHGEFATDPASTGLAWFAGRDAGGELNVYRLDVSGSQPVWATTSNGDNISAGTLYTDTNYAQKPFDINFYKNNYGVVGWNRNVVDSPKYHKLYTTTNSLDSASSSVPGAASATWTRVKFYQDPNEVEFLAVYQNTNIDYAAVFWDGGASQFYGSGSQAWQLIATSTGAASANDDATAFSYTARNSPPNTPTSLGQFKADATTTIANGAWTTEDQVYLRASSTDPDTSEVITLYAELIGNGSSFTSSTSQPSGACVYGTAYNDCASKIWFVASSSPGDWSITPFGGSINITGLPDSFLGYKWQVIACDDSADCSNWVKFNATTPNFKVDTTPPTPPGPLTIASKTSTSVTLAFGTSTTEANFLEYRIYYKPGASGVTESDTRWNDANLNFINYSGATSTTVTGLASSTQYVFNVWAHDQAGWATSSVEVATTTNAGPYLKQTSYLLENDDGADVNANSGAAASNTPLTNLNKGERVVVRLQLENTGGDTAWNKTYRLQFENQTDAPGTWTDVGAATEMSWGVGLSGGNNTPLTLSKAAANANLWLSGSWHEGVNQTGSYSLTNGYYTEFAFVIFTNNALLGKTYRFRLINSTDNAPLNNYGINPTLSIIASESLRHSKGNYASLPTDTSDLIYYLDPKGYVDVVADDDTNRDQLTSGLFYPVMQFVTKNSTSSQAITATWNGQSSVPTASSTVYLQVYRFGTTNAWLTVASNTSAAADTDFTLSGNLNAKLSEYYGAGSWTYWRVYQDSGPHTLRTDYFNAAFSAPVPEVRQLHYRWRTDDGTEATANWLEAEDAGSPTASTSLAKGTNIRLRLSAANLGGGGSNYAYRLEYATTTSNCASDPGGWTAVPTDNSRAFRMATTSNFGNGSSTVARLANSEGYNFAAGSMIKDPSNQTASTSLAESQYTENEYVFYATVAAYDGWTYCFRTTNAGATFYGYDRYAELTMSGNPNTAPYFTANPSDGGSATDTPTNYGDSVVFTGTGQDDESDDYYLAVCKTSDITAGNDAPPICNGGNWCISALASSTVEASCNYVTATTSEVLPWYAFACDHHAGVGVAKCSVVSQGGTGTNDDSPFNINHPPTLSSITTAPDNQDPGSTFNISTVSSDTDTAGTNDTLSLFVCRTNSASAFGCTGGPSDTVCSVTGTSSPNASCTYVDVAPTPAGANTYYGFVFDNHSLGAAANSRAGSYTINNVPTVLGAQTLNNGAQIVLNMKDAPDKQISTVNPSVVDQNGCQTLVSAVAAIYMSNATSSYNCVANDNDCYQVGAAGCVISACDNPDDTEATYTCTAGMKYFAIPTDNSGGNDWEPYNWLSRLQVYDGATYAATSSPGVELKTSEALIIPEDLIDYGSDIYAGQNTGAVNQLTTVVNAGNAPIDTDLSGSDMTGIPVGTITVNNEKWNLASGFDWSASGTPLSIGGQLIDTPLPKPTSSATSSSIFYWGIGIPFSTEPSTFYGQTSFTAVLDTSDW